MTAGPPPVAQPAAQRVGLAAVDGVGRVLRVAVAMSAAYALALLLDVLRPLAGDDGPPVGLLAAGRPVLPQVMFWAVVVSWLVAALIGIGGGVWQVASPGQRRRRIGGAVRAAVAVVLLLPYPVFPVVTAARGVGWLAVCLISTGMGLWAVCRVRVHRRLPGRLLLAAFGWGALVANGFGAAMNLWYRDFAARYFIEIGELDVAQQVRTWANGNAAGFEELGKVAGVVVICALARRYLDGAVSGLVLGAATGLGFNLVETVEYLTANADQVGQQFWMRQVVGLLAAHTGFAALAGAGVAVAAQLPDRAVKRTAVLCGVSAAIGGHFASNMVFAWFADRQRDWDWFNPAVDMLLVQPLLLIVVQGPIVVMYLLLLRRGLDGQAAGLAAGIAAEAQLGLGAITAAEVPVLLDRAQRRRLAFAVLRRFGWAAAGNLRRLHAAQLDLAANRWQQLRGDPPDDPQHLRERVQVHKVRHAELLAGRLPDPSSGSQPSPGGPGSAPPGFGAAGSGPPGFGAAGFGAAGFGPAAASSIGGNR